MAEGDSQNQGTSQSSSDGAQQAQSGSAASGGASSQAQTSQQQTSQQAAPAKPTDLPDAFWDADKGSLNTAALKEVIERDAAEQVRRNTLPKEAKEVKLDLPKDFQLPVGVDFKLDTARPELGKLQEWAVKHGVPQDAVSEALGIYAGTMVAERAMLKQAFDAEVTKLGNNGPARIDNLTTALTSLVGEPLAKAMKGMMVTADIVSGLEQLVSKNITQGAARFSGAHRDTNEPGRVSQEQWSKMSPAERLDYNRRFDQARMPEWRDPRAA